MLFYCSELSVYKVRVDKVGIGKMGIDSKKVVNSDQILLLARGWDLGIGLG